MENYAEHKVALSKIACDLDEFKENKDTFKKKELRHIKNLIRRIKHDMKCLNNWSTLDRRFLAKTGFSVNSFLTRLEKAAEFIKICNYNHNKFTELREYVGNSDLDDAKFIYKLHCTEFKKFGATTVAVPEILSDYKKNILDVEKEYYKAFYSIRSLHMPIDGEHPGMLRVTIQFFVFLYVTFTLILLALAFIFSVREVNEELLLDFLLSVPVASLVLSAIFWFVHIVTFDWSENIVSVIFNLVGAAFYLLVSPITKIFLVIKGLLLQTKCHASSKASLRFSRKHENATKLVSPLNDLFGRLKKMEDDSEVRYTNRLNSIAEYLWKSGTLEEACKKYIDATHRSAEDNTTNYSYSPSRAENNVDKGTYDPLSYTAHNHLKERIGKMLQEKSYSTVAIFHSPVTNQWYRLNKYGQDEYVSIERTSSGDFFVARDGKSYKIKSTGANRDSIYFYES